MNNTDFINALGDVGAGIAAIIILGFLLFWVLKSRFSDQKVLIKLLDADQLTRERNTEAITKLTVTIEQFNIVNGNNQKDCTGIHTAMTEQVTRIERIADRLS